VSVVLFTKRLKLLANATTPNVLVHRIVAHTALLGVAVLLGPSAMFTFTEMS